MQKIIKQIYDFKILKSFNIFSFTCLSINKDDYVLYLKNPKVFLDVKNSITNHNIVEFDDIIISPVSQSNYIKKKKSDLILLDNKKNKVWQKKKLKTKIHHNKNLVDMEDGLTNLNHLHSTRMLKNNKIKNNFVDPITTKSLPFVSELEKKNQKTIFFNDSLTVRELSKIINISTSSIIKWLFLQGISVTINQILDISMCNLIADNYGFTVLKQNKTYNLVVQNKQKNIFGKVRAPVITILGHVDHGKTTLLQAIKEDNQLISEVGNITQSLGAYEIFLESDQYIDKLIFIDTPGHEAFVEMRTTSAQITDIAILVVSADDGLKTQTVEAINHIQSREIPFIVVINKIDKATANINKVMKQLTEYNIHEHNDFTNYCIVQVSALTGRNIPLLLSKLIEMSKKQQLKTNTSKLAEGQIIEAYLDKQKGSVAHILIQTGTLNIGNIIVAGNMFGKVKAINNSLGHKISSIKSVALVKILCFSSVPSVGIPFKVVKNEKEARKLISSHNYSGNLSNILNTRVSLDDLYKKQDNSVLKHINLIIKTNTQGSINAITYSLSNIPQEKVQINLISVASGEVSLTDIQLASTSNSIILVFNLNISTNIMNSAKNMGISIHKFEIIYDLIDYVKNYMLSNIEVTYKHQIIGNAIVKNVFQINKGIVAGCLVIDGKLKKDAYFNLKREDKIIYTGNIDSLKRLKEDIREVYADNECGIMCKGYNFWYINDIIEVYEKIPLEKNL